MVDRGSISRVVVALGEKPADVSHLASRFPEVTFESVTSDDLTAQVPSADALLISGVGHALTAESAPRLRWVQTAGAGVERYIEGALVGDSVVLTNGSGVMAPNMAEHVIGLMTGFARGFPDLMRAQQRREWRAGVGTETVFELGGQTVLFIGIGDIAQETVKRLAGFDMRILGVRRSAGVSGVPVGFDRVVSINELNSVLPLADHVVSSVPHTPATRHVFNAELFSSFKPGAYFYNVGRGTSVVQDDLIAALNSGQLAGAGLDVTDPEPLPPDHPLWNAPNVVITGHTAGMTPNFQSRLIDLFADNLQRWQEGRELRNVVNLSRGY